MPKPAKGMNDRLRLFCELILQGSDKGKAYTQAGFRSKHPSSGATAALKNPVVQEYLDERRAEMRERTNVTQDKVIQELARIAFADIRELASWNESGVVFMPSDELSADEAASIAMIKSRRRIRRDKEGGETETVELEVKLHQKLDAIEKLNKILGVYQADRINEADRQADLLATVLWRYVMALHLERGLTVAEALKHAEHYPEEVEQWGKEVKLLPADTEPSSLGGRRMVSG